MVNRCLETPVCFQLIESIAIEYVGIADSETSHSLHSPLYSERSLVHIQMIETHIIIPLVKLPAMQGFCDAIMTTTIDLCDGVLRNVRDVEVNLALNGSVSCNTKRGSDTH